MREIRQCDTPLYTSFWKYWWICMLLGFGWNNLAVHFQSPNEKKRVREKEGERESRRAGEKKVDNKLKPWWKRQRETAGPNRISTYYLSSLWHNFEQQIKIKLNEPNIYDWLANLNVRVCFFFHFKLVSSKSGVGDRPMLNCTLENFVYRFSSGTCIT